MNEDEEEFSAEELEVMQTKLKEKRKVMEAALREYVELRANYTGFPDAYMTSYAISTEFVSPELVQADANSWFIVVPEDQPPSTTRGLFGFGADSYSRQSVRVRVETDED